MVDVCAYSTRLVTTSLQSATVLQKFTARATDSTDSTSGGFAGGFLGGVTCPSQSTAAPIQTCQSLTYSGCEGTPREGLDLSRNPRTARSAVLAICLVSLFIGACSPSSGSDPVAVQPTSSPTPASGAQVSSSYEIGFLGGRELSLPSNLVVLSGNFALDVDSGVAERISGLPDRESQRFWSLSAGDRAFVVVDCDTCRSPEVFSLDGTLAHGESVGYGFPAPAPDGIWLKRFLSDSTCVLAKVTLDGRTRTPERSFDCEFTIIEESRLGLVAFTTDLKWALIDPDTFEPIFFSGAIHGVIGDEVMISDRDGFVLVDPTTGSETRALRPTEVGRPSYGKPSPDGKFMAVSFEHPAWPGPRQRLDVWVLQIDTMNWVRLPSMPVAVALKTTDMAWAPDGRLVVFGWFEDVGDAIVVWRPGATELEILETELNPAGSLVARNVG